MNTLRRNLKIAFSLVSPEDVIADLKERGDLCYEKQAMRVNLHEMSEEYYIMASRKLLDNYSIDEIRNLYQEMNSLLESFGDIPKSLFQLLVRYGNEVLELDNQVPLVKRSELMSYRAISLDLGQDIFTTSFLAYKTCRSSTITSAIPLNPKIRFPRTAASRCPFPATRASSTGVSPCAMPRGSVRSFSRRSTA